MYQSIAEDAMSRKGSVPDAAPAKYSIQDSGHVLQSFLLLRNDLLFCHVMRRQMTLTYLAKLQVTMTFCKPCAL